jgi:anti-sigma regulatory factor (Ser/Thr protein kinase)
LDYKINNLDDIFNVSEKLKVSNLSKFTIDISGINFIKPSHLVLLRCLFDLCKIKNISLNIFNPNTSAFNYAGRMGLFNATSYEYPFKKHNRKERFSELTLIESDSQDEDLYFNLEGILKKSSMNISILGDLTEVISELLNNIFYHSGKTPNSGQGYYMAQIYMNYIELAIADMGIGFRGSHERLHGVETKLNDDEIIDKYLKLGESSTGDISRGVGLSEVMTYISNCGGALNIYSGNGKFILGEKFGEVYNISSPLSGTLVLFKIPI